MFLFIGIVMTTLQGGYVRRLKPGRHVRACITAILLLIPSFVIIGIATSQFQYYLGLLLYCYSSAVVVSCLTTVMSNYGTDDEKGTITGIGRSLGALARTFGPIFSSISTIFVFFNCVLLLKGLNFIFICLILSLLDVWCRFCLHPRCSTSRISIRNYNWRRSKT